MRRIDLIALTLVAVVASAGVTYYLAKHPLRRAREERIAIGVSKAKQKLAPRDILKPPQPTLAKETPSAGEGDKATTPTESQRTSLIVHPPWQPGGTHVLGAYPVTKPGDFIHPTWSPLGLDLVFTTRQLDGVWTAGPNSFDARQISDDRLAGAEMTWANDGLQVIIQSIDRRPVALMLTGEKYPLPELPQKVVVREGQIYIRDEDGGLKRITGSQDRFYGPKLSPDETLVAYIGIETGIYISTVDGKHTISVGKGENPSWLPDSSGIVYDIPMSDGLTVIDGDLWYAAADGSERTNITNTPGIVESHPAVSPDGQRIAFIAEGAVYVGRFIRPRKR